MFNQIGSSDPILRQIIFDVLKRSLVYFWALPDFSQTRQIPWSGYIKMLLRGCQYAVRFSQMKSFCAFGVDGEKTIKEKPLRVIAGFIVGLLEDSGRIFNYALVTSNENQVGDPISNRAYDFFCEHRSLKYKLIEKDYYYPGGNTHFLSVLPPIVFFKVFSQSLRGKIIRELMIASKVYAFEPVSLPFVEKESVSLIEEFRSKMRFPDFFCYFHTLDTTWILARKESFEQLASARNLELSSVLQYLQQMDILYIPEGQYSSLELPVMIQGDNSLKNYDFFILKKESFEKQIESALLDKSKNQRSSRTAAYISIEAKDKVLRYLKTQPIDNFAFVDPNNTKTAAPKNIDQKPSVDPEGLFNGPENFKKCLVTTIQNILQKKTDWQSAKIFYAVDGRLYARPGAFSHLVRETLGVGEEYQTYIKQTLVSDKKNLKALSLGKLKFFDKEGRLQTSKGREDLLRFEQDFLSEIEELNPEIEKLERLHLEAEDHEIFFN